MGEYRANAAQRPRWIAARDDLVRYGRVSVKYRESLQIKSQAKNHQISKQRKEHDKQADLGGRPGEKMMSVKNQSEGGCSNTGG